MKQHIYLLIQLMVSFSLVACGGGSGSDNTTVQEVINVNGISVSVNEASIVVGESLTLVTTILPGNANDQSVTWSATNTKMYSGNYKRVTWFNFSLLNLVI